MLSGSTGGPGRATEERLFKKVTEANPNLKVQHLERPAGGSQTTTTAL